MDSLPSGTLFTWEEADRAVAAARLRSDVLQALTALTIDCSRPGWGMGGRSGSQRDCGEMLGMLRSAVDCTLLVASELRPLQLDACGIAAALQLLATDHARRAGAACEMSMDESMELDEPVALVVFRVVQDLLRGARMDGPIRTGGSVGPGAGEVTVRLWRAPSAQSEGGAGTARALEVIRERVHMVAGSVDVDNGPASGLQVDIRIPTVPRAGS